MKFHRIYALILRYLYLSRHSLDKATDMLYWPLLDLSLWGLTSTYFQSYAADDTVVFAVISGIIFWFIVIRGQYEMSMNILEELWNKNMVNQFVSPLMFTEMIISSAIISIIKATLGFLVGALFAWLLFGIHIIYFGISILPLALILLGTGWAIGLMVAGTILRFGTKLQSLAWTLVWVISPFAAIYYPITILPSWGRSIASFVPPSYAFEGIRALIAGGTLNGTHVAFALLLNAIYFIGALYYIHKSFGKALQKGLVKLY